MKKKIPLNKFDKLVERLVSEFIKIPNFDLVSTDELANKVFNIVTFRIADVISYKELICQHFIPATNKAIFQSKRDFQNSQYKFLLTTKNLDFTETLYDTIRLSYVGLFHKLENYITDVIRIPDLIFSELYESEGTVANWAKQKFNFDIKDWQQFSITHKINWICNCVKHKDGLPIKEPKPNRFKYICDLLIKFYPLYLQTMVIFAQHKLAMEKPLLKEDYKYSPEIYDRQIENLNKIQTAVEQFVKTLKEMRE